MKIAAVLVAIFTIIVGIVGIVSPEYGTTVRRAYFAAPATLYAAVALAAGIPVGTTSDLASAA